VKKAPKATKSQAKPSAKAKLRSPDLVKLADYINPRALDAAQMVMVVAASLEPKEGAPLPLGDDVRAGLVRILQEVTEIILGIKSEVSSALHGRGRE